MTNRIHAKLGLPATKIMIDVEPLPHITSDNLNQHGRRKYTCIGKAQDGQDRFYREMNRTFNSNQANRETTADQRKYV